MKRIGDRRRNADVETVETCKHICLVYNFHDHIAAQCGPGLVDSRVTAADCEANNRGRYSPLEGRGSRGNGRSED